MHEHFKSLSPKITEKPSLVPSIRALAHTVPPRVAALLDTSSPLRKRRSRAPEWIVLALLAGAAGLSTNGEIGPNRSDLEPSIVHGQAEPKLSESGNPQHWGVGKVVVTIDDSVDSAGPWARGAIQDAFGSWQSSGIHLPRLVFSASKGQKFVMQQDGVNSVIYGEIDIKGHRNDLAVTIAYSDPQTGEIVESDILINKKHPFAALDKLAEERASAIDDDSRVVTVQGSTSVQRQASCSGMVLGSCGSKFDLQSVLTHEVGHFYGLSEDFEDPYATMFECTSTCETHKRVLADDDVDAMTEIYPEGAPSDPDTQNAAMAPGCSAGPLRKARPSGLGVTALLGALALFIRRRSPAEAAHRHG